MDSPSLRRGWVAFIAGTAVLAHGVQDALGQDTGALTGTVISTVAQGSAEAVPGVTVRLSGHHLERVTDAAGRFEFQVVPAGRHELLIEVIGCRVGSRMVRVTPGERTAVHVRVDRPVIAIPEMVVTGRATGASEAERSYSVGRLDAEDLERRPARSIADLIRGEFPGARIMQGSGLPGQEISIQFRGPGSISSGRPPLIVVDGVITGGGMIDLDPRDVAGITVLKGSAASAHHGSRGQAGVIEITTRGGRAGMASRGGPLIIVDGVVSDTGLADLGSDEIEEMDMVTGPAAALLFGARAAESGVVTIVTRRGTREQEHGTLFSRCVEPSP